jgi:hypothetical protein
MEKFISFHNRRFLPGGSLDFFIVWSRENNLESIKKIPDEHDVYRILPRITTLLWNLSVITCWFQRLKSCRFLFNRILAIVRKGIKKSSLVKRRPLAVNDFFSFPVNRRG